MKATLSKIYNKVGIKSIRTKNIANHIAWSFFFKVGSVTSNFLLVPLSIKFLDSENYGIWLTLSSFIAWFSFFDIGLGHGLRNKFAEAKAKGDFELARGYISSAYFTIGGVCLIFLLTSFILSINISWSSVFNTSILLEKELQLLMPIVLGFFAIQLVLKLITSIYTADQNHSMQSKVNFLNSFGALVFLWVLTQFSKSSLLIYGSVISVLPVIILILISIFAFNSKYKKFKPSFTNYKKRYLKEIFGLGFSFFIIQISGIILFSTDNIIITQLFGPDAVVPYNLSFKYFSISLMALSMIVTPYWSSITEAYVKGEFVWIKKSMKNLLKFTTIAIIGVVVLLFLSPVFYQVWIGSQVLIPFSLSMSMAFYFIITIIYSPFTYFINGTGKVKLQMYSILITALVNIPLSIFMAKTLGLGIKGVIITTIICIVPHAILCPIQYFKLINNNATGVWNK